MASLRQPTPCASYLPGHCPHWIQAKKSLEHPGPTVSLRLVRLEETGLVILAHDSKEFRLWNHDPFRLEEALASRRVTYQPDWHLLHAGSGLFSMSREPLGPCKNPPGEV